MEITVQSSALKERREKDVLSLMRNAHQEAMYEYHVIQNGYLVRFTSDGEGVIPPLLHYEYLKNSDIPALEYGNFYLIYPIGENACQIITVHDWVIRSSKIELRDSITAKTFKNSKNLYVDTSIINEFKVYEPNKLPSLKEPEFKDTDYYFGAKSTFPPQIIKYGITALIIIATLTLLWWFMTDSEEDIESKPSPPIVKIKYVDEYYEYKKQLIGAVRYDDIAPALMAAVFIANKLPNGWVIEDITATNQGVEAKILNFGGKTKEMKYFRETNGYKDFIEVAGQYARFYVPIENIHWFDWTKKIASFTELRDETMDVALTLGADIQSNHEDKHQFFTQQKMGLRFESVPLTHLDILQTYLNNKPIFIDSVSISFGSLNNRKLITAELQLNIIGE